MGWKVGRCNLELYRAIILIAIDEIRLFGLFLEIDGYLDR